MQINLCYGWKYIYKTSPCASSPVLIGCKVLLGTAGCMINGEGLSDRPGFESLLYYLSVVYGVICYSTSINLGFLTCKISLPTFECYEDSVKIINLEQTFIHMYCMPSTVLKTITCIKPFSLCNTSRRKGITEALVLSIYKWMVGLGKVNFCWVIHLVGDSSGTETR